MDASKNTPYTTIPISDEHDDARSSTEVDEALMGDEKAQWRKQRPQTRRERFSSALVRHWWLVDTSLLMLIVCLLLLLRAEWRSSSSSGSASQLQVGGDHTGGGPTFSTKIVKWDSEPRFVPENPHDFFSNETLATWNEIMPAGTGWSEADTFFTTTMTHQLHCVFMMARIYSSLQTNNEHPLPDDHDAHFLHCVDYLRQAIMCAADVALEPHGPSDPDDLGPLDGSWGGHHVCKDYGEVTKYLEEQISQGYRTVLPIDD